MKAISIVRPDTLAADVPVVVNTLGIGVANDGGLVAVVLGTIDIEHSH